MAAEYILGLDYGQKRVGVAVAHVVAKLPHPLVTLLNTETLLDDINKIIAQEGICQVVVGLPRDMKGDYTAQTHEVEAFADTLAAAVPVPVAMVDETLTSVDAENMLGGTRYVKGDIDALAATYILERYLAENPAGSEEHV